MSKIFIVDSSLRTNSNSSLLASSFAKGAKESGNEVILVKIKDMDLHFCRGCLTCAKTKKCIIADRMSFLLEEVSSSDILVLAAPVYYYGLPGQLKTFLDRLNPLYFKENKLRDIYFLSVAGEEEDDAFDGSIDMINRWASCFDGAKLVSSIKAKGIDKPNEIIDKGDYLKEAFELGKSIK